MLIAWYTSDGSGTLQWNPCNADTLIPLYICICTMPFRGLCWMLLLTLDLTDSYTTMKHGYYDGSVLCSLKIPLARIGLN